jgi:hypothetical protein
MTERPPHEAMPSAEREIVRDLEALAAHARHAVPDLADSLTAARRRHRATPRWKELLMPITESPARRPWLAAAAVAVLVVLGALCPISWQRTVGHDVALTLTGVHDTAHASAIANEMKSVLGVDHVSMRADALSGGAALSFAAYVPAGHGIDAAARAQALAAALRSRGYAATVSATPRREQIAGTLYAYARDLVVRVETDGKTAAQIEADIRSQLAAAGVSNTQVSVTDQGDRREVKVTAESHDPNHAPDDLKLELTKDGRPVADTNGMRVQMKKLIRNGVETMVIDVVARGRTATVNVPNASRLSDAQLRLAVESQLRAAGLDLAVTVSGGTVTLNER